MDGYKISKSGVVKLTDSEKGVLSIRKKDKSMMNMSDIKQLNDIMVKKYKDKDVEFYIRIFGNLGPITIKAFGKQFDEDKLDDYLHGRVKSTAKFETLFSLEIGYAIKN